MPRPDTAAYSAAARCDRVKIRRKAKGMRWYSKMLSQLKITVPQNTMMAFTNAISGAPKLDDSDNSVGAQ